MKKGSIKAGLVLMNKRCPFLSFAFVVLSQSHINKQNKNQLPSFYNVKTFLFQTKIKNTLGKQTYPSTKQKKRKKKKEKRKRKKRKDLHL